MRSIGYSPFYALAGLLAIVITTFSQSSDSNFPTPLTSSLINSTIKARDIGDARLTTQYYVFGGEQGDIFINVVTKNFNGDIDVFTVDGMRPLTKMVIYSDNGVNETGRLIYLRKPEKLLIRIEGRPPDDDPATIQIKFGGSFVAIKESSGNEPAAPIVATIEAGDIRVNSVGTILKVPEIKKSDPVLSQPKNTTTKDSLEKQAPPKTDIVADKNNKTTKSPVKTQDTKKTEKRSENKNIEEKENVKTESVSKKETKPAEQLKKPKTESAKDEERPDPLASIRLVVIFKNGEKIERALSDVIKFGVDKGILTILVKDGTIRRYSMLDVEKVTIE